MNTIAAMVFVVVCAVAYLVAQRRRRRRNIQIQRVRIEKMPSADLKEELGIACGFAIRHLEGGRRSQVSDDHFRMCLDRAAILRRRLAAEEGMAPRSEAEWRRIVLDELKSKQARRAAAGLPAAMQRVVPTIRAAQANWVALAVSGEKTVVCWSEREMDTEGLRRLAVGQRAVYVSEEGEPMLAVECVGTETRHFEDIERETALAEGEHASLEEWREDRRIRFAAGGRCETGLRIICEKIRVVEKLGG